MKNGETIGKTAAGGSPVELQNIASDGAALNKIFEGNPAGRRGPCYSPPGGRGRKPRGRRGNALEFVCLGIVLVVLMGALLKSGVAHRGGPVLLGVLALSVHLAAGVLALFSAFVRVWRRLARNLANNNDSVNYETTQLESRPASVLECML